VDDGKPGSAIPPVVSAAIVGIFIIMLIGSLYYARSVLLPIVIATLASLTFSPLIRFLRRFGISPAISAVAVVVALALVFAAASALLSQPIADMIKQAPTVTHQLSRWFTRIGEPFAVLSRASREVESIADGGSTVQTVVVARPGLLSWAAGTLADFGTTMVATLLLLPFLLASGDSLKVKLVQVLPNLSRKKQSLRILREIENEVARYLATTLTINAGLGLVIGSIMAIIGMPNPVLWGVGAMLLNFVPYAGALTGITLALAVGAVTFSDVGHILLPPLAYLAVQVIEGGFVTPYILGRRLELSSVAILVTLALTTWIWGVVGAIIGVPLLVATKVFCDHLPGLAPFAVFLAAEPSDREEPEPAAAALPAEPERLQE
jgi:predicted PurR-regulated permease PerM